jgi:hypothetical protein
MSTGADVYRPIEPVGGGYEGLNRRKYPRYALTLPGRFMRADKLDHPCRLIDISAEAAAMTTPLPLVVGEKLIVYLMHLGGLEGTVVRVLPGSFALLISGTQRKRDKLAVQIPRLAAQSEIPEGEEREFPRVAGEQAALLALPDGSTMVCPLQDLSMSGASVLTPARPELGAQVMIDKRRAVVVRHHDIGIGVEFVNAGFTERSAFGLGLRRDPHT